MNGVWSRVGRSLSALALCGLATSTSVDAGAAPPAAHVSEAKDRKSVSITVYNADFGLVREVRELSGLPSGQVALEFRDVASTIQPETVAVKALPGAFVVEIEAIAVRPSAD